MERVYDGQCPSYYTDMTSSRGASVITSASYTHYDSGNRKTYTNEEGTVVTYTYDDLSRLTDASHDRQAGVPDEGVQSEQYRYDRIGNRLEETNSLINNFFVGYTSNSRYDAGEITRYENETGEYYGPVTLREGTRDFDYDNEGRLIKVTVNEGGVTTVVNYKYGPFGRRVERSVTKNGSPVSTERYLYDGEDIVAVYDGSNNLVKEFIHGPGIDEPLAVKTGGNWYYYLVDGLGSTVYLTDSSGQEITDYHFEYDSFGNLISGTFDRTYSYTGREWDPETGLYYYRARFYDPVTGRFISKDPIGFAGGDVNLYSYVGQNPVNFTDPSGMMCIYSQNSGQMICANNTGLYLDQQGYSGSMDGAGVNQSMFEGIPYVGPIPKGGYTVGENQEMPGRKLWGRPLIPNAETRGRIRDLGRDPDSFWLHGGFADANNMTASKGCVILNAGQGRNDIPVGEPFMVR